MRWELRFFRGVDDDIDIVGRDDGQPPPCVVICDGKVDGKQRR